MNFNNTLYGNSFVVLRSNENEDALDTPPVGVLVHNLQPGIFTESVDRYTQDKPTISQLGVCAHGIDLYKKDINDTFYNSYLP